jgi:hypothetical protein
MFENICHRKKFISPKYTKICNYTFLYYVCIDPIYIWTSLKMVLMPLNINHY